MAAKAKLTSEQWQECKNRWEGDPRDGYMWLVAEIKLPVTDEAVRQRAKKDDWRKASHIRTIVQQAHLRADDVSGKVGTAAIDAAIDLRSGIIETHRAEWGSHRELFTLAAIATDLDLCRIAKMSVEMLKVRQEGERRAWGLDAIAAPEDHSPSSEELDRIYENAMAKMETMSLLAKKQYEKLNW